jgi:hypothetical protein
MLKIFYILFENDFQITNVLKSSSTHDEHKNASFFINSNFYLLHKELLSAIVYPLYNSQNEIYKTRFERENKLKSWEQLLIILSFCQTQKVLIINLTAESGSGLEDHIELSSKSPLGRFFLTQSQAHTMELSAPKSVFLTLYPAADVHCKKRL